jgi:hypothetical protein
MQRRWGHGIVRMKQDFNQSMWSGPKESAYGDESVARALRSATAIVRYPTQHRMKLAAIIALHA